VKLRSISNGVSLRIQPLCDFITYGYLSSDGNGYRNDLLECLSGNPVQYIGSVRSGNMTDNYNEGHPDAVITRIATFAENSLPERPNVVLLMAGTNDGNTGLDISTTMPERLGMLIDEVVSACPDAAVIVAQRTPITSLDCQYNIGQFNDAIPGIVAARANAGKHVLVVNMSLKITTADLKDGLHPTDYGYDLMSEVWLAGIQQAGSNAGIKPPV
jgi:lysophospholipase L1-like esterase